MTPEPPLRSYAPAPKPIPDKIRGSVKRKPEPPVKKNKNKTWWMLAGVLAATFFAYANSFTVPFFLDNEEIILRDARIHTVSSTQVHRILTQQYWETATTGLYRPLTTLSYLFNYAILGGGANPESYHWINLLLHLANVAMVYLLFAAIFEQSAIPLLASALWALHPVQTEAVTNIVGRADLLVAFGVLAALLCHRQAVASGGARKAAWLAAMFLAAAVAAFSKESGVVVLPALAAYDLTFVRGGSWRARIPGYVAAIVPCAAYLYARAQVLAGAPVLATAYCDNPLLGAGFWTARLTAVKVIGKYFWLLVWPANLSYDYSYNQIPLFGTAGGAEDAKAIAALAGCAAAAVFAVWAWRRQRGVFFALAFAAVTFAPVANLLLVIGSIMGERFLYLPSIGVAMCAAYGFYKLVPQKLSRAATVGAGLVLVAYAARTYDRNGDWLDQSRFWRTGLEAAPNSYKTNLNMATTITGLTSNDWDRAIRYADRALAILDPLPDERNVGNAYRDAAQLYRDLGDLLAAKKPAGAVTAGTAPEHWYRKALAAVLRSEKIELVYDADYNRENAKLGRPGLTKVPSKLYLEMGRVYLRLHDLPHAVSAFQLGIALEAAPPLLEEAADAFEQAGDSRAAVLALEESYTVDSNRPVLGKLVELYGKVDPTGCSVSREGGAAAINPDCPRVHADICEASKNIAGTYVRRGQMFEAGAVRKRAMDYLGCAAELVN